jgi:hypothetical protein
MKSTFSRRFRRRTPSLTENSFFKKEGRREHNFFGSPSQETFFQPVTSIQRKCEKCEEDDKKVHRMTDQKEEEKKLQRQPDRKEEGKKLQRKENDSTPHAVTNNYYSNISGGQNLPKEVNQFYATKMGHDFNNVKIHTGNEAVKSASEINARAYTTGNHIVFNEGEYNPSTHTGRKLLAHELTHVVQQQEASGSQIQRKVQFNVTEWNAEKVEPGALTNQADSIDIPKGKQILIGGLVEVNGDATDKCTDYEFGMTQTAWIAWVHQYYSGRTSSDGSMVVSYNASVPIRDPAPSGSIWYRDSMVNSPSSCGDSAGTFHNDGPWNEIPKTRNNESVKGKPLNYLTGYTRGLHLVTYLAGKKIGGSFLPKPLKFRYWNSIQNFTFKPNYTSPTSTWGSEGSIKVNIGSAGSGETSDAPYYTTAGTTYNAHFNDPANWITTEHK